MITLIVLVTDNVYIDFLKYEENQKETNNYSSADLLKQIVSMVDDNYECKNIGLLNHLLCFKIDGKFDRYLEREARQKGIRSDYMISLKLHSFFEEGGVNMAWISVSVTTEVYKKFLNYEHLQKKISKVKRADVLLKILKEVGNDYEVEELKSLNKKLYFDLDQDMYKALVKEADQKKIRLEYMVFLKMRKYFVNHEIDLSKHSTTGAIEKEAEENEKGTSE